METNTPNVGASQNEVLLKLLFTKAATPLYEGSSISMLSTTLFLLNWSTMDELFSLLNNELLPKKQRC